MAKKEVKTNVMRMLDKAGVAYTPHAYDASDGAIDGRPWPESWGRTPPRCSRRWSPRAPAKIILCS